MKVFRVEVSKELYVLAEDRDEAEEIAINNADEDLEWGAIAAEVRSLDHVPGDERECLIWHEGREDITIAEAFAKAATT